MGDAIYRLALSDGMIEHELDHLFIGYYDGAFVLDSNEVSEVVWRDINRVHKDMTLHPEYYTAWFRILLPAVAEAVDISTGSLREPVRLRHAAFSGK